MLIFQFINLSFTAVSACAEILLELTLLEFVEMANLGSDLIDFLFCSPIWYNEQRHSIESCDFILAIFANVRLNDV